MWFGGSLKFSSHIGLAKSTGIFGRLVAKDGKDKETKRQRIEK